jgi:hypothetical protein
MAGLSQLRFEVENFADVRTARLGFLFRYALPLLAFIALTAIYACIFSQQPKDADCVNAYLAGLDMGRGNWRLSQWFMATDNFYLQDVLAYAILTRIAGDNLFLMAILPAAIWAGIVTTVGILGESSPHNRLWWWSLSVVAAVLGVPIIGGSGLMVFIASAPVHLFTVLDALWLFMLADRYRRGGGVSALGSFAILSTAAALSDPLTAFIVTLPVSGAALLCAGSPLLRRWLLIATALGTFAVGHRLVAFNEALGGFYFAWSGGDKVNFAPLSDMGAHVAWILDALMQFLSADFTDRPAAVAVPALLHLPVVLVIVCTASAIIARVATSALHVRELDLPFLDGALALGIAIDIAACAFSTQMIAEFSGRYVLPAVIFGVALAARRAPPFPALIVAGVLGLLGSTYAAATDTNYIDAFSHPRIRMTFDVRDLAHWLEDRGQNFGYAQYWTSAPLRAASHGKIESAALIADGGQLSPFYLLTRKDWYPEPLTARRPFFVVIDPHGPPYFVFKESDVVDLFGQPTERETTGDYTVYIYR